MASNSNRRRKANEFEKSKVAVSLQVEKLTRKLGLAVAYHNVAFIVFPALVAVPLLILSVIAPTPPNPAENDGPSVKEMFLATKNHPVSLHRFEEELWENSRYDAQNTRQFAHLIITSKHNVLGRKLQQEILRLHEFITNMEIRDPIHVAEVTYKDVCMNPFKQDPLNSNQSITCATDVIVKMFMCMKTYKFLTLNLRIDSNTKILWGFLHHNEAVITSSLFIFDPWCKNQIGKEVFFGQTICLVDDHMHSEAISAGCVRLNYYLKDFSRRDNIKARFWLQELEKKLTEFDSDLMKVTDVTSETLNTQWWNLVRPTVLNGALLCIVYFISSLALVSKIGNVFNAVYLSSCAVLSLIATMITTYFLHSIIYVTPRFNMGLCAIFVTVVHFVFLLVFMECCFQTYDRKQLRGKAHTDDCFIECYRFSFLSNFGYLFLFASTFGVSAIHDSLPSLRALCITSCLGFAVAYFYQVTLFPACVYLYNSRVYSVVEKFRFHIATVNQEENNNMEYSVSESVFLEDETSPNPKNDAAADENKSKRTEKQKNLKTKLDNLYHRFTVFVVCDYMRAVCALLYITYFSLSCVGTVHFTEGIAPKQLVSRDSKAFRYFTSLESYFKPHGPQFTVYGRFHGDPWDVSGLKELYKIHKTLVEMDAIDSNLSINWFQNYFEFDDVTDFIIMSKKSWIYEKVFSVTWELSKETNFQQIWCLREVKMKNVLQNFTVHNYQYCIRCRDLVNASSKGGTISFNGLMLTGSSDETQELKQTKSDKKHISEILKSMGFNFWSSPAPKLSDEFWSSFNWSASWINFTQTEVYKNDKNNIESEDMISDSAHHDDEDDAKQVRFSWFYHTINSHLPSKQDELITQFQDVSKAADNTIIAMLVFDAPELDWWTSVKADRFLHCYTALIAFGLVSALFLMILIKRALVVVWSCVNVVSVCFGTVGLLSLSGIRSDPLSIPCVFFAIPCTLFVVLNLLATFFDFSGGRAESAAESLKKNGSRSALFCAVLFFSSLILANRTSYIHAAPLTGLFLLVLNLLLHIFFFVPFALTVFPPRKKQKKVYKKKPDVKQSRSKDTLDAATDNQTNNSISDLNGECAALEHVTSV